jgi:two-component system, cell cycle response regulator
MDPLVSCALWVQRQAARGAGTALGAALGAYLVWSVANRPPLSFDLAALAVGLALLGHAAARRLLRQPLEEELARRDAALFTLVTVLCYAAVLRTPGGLGGPFYPVLYGLSMLVASFARPSAVAWVIAFAISLEAGISVIGLGEHEELRLSAHAGLLIVFSLLNMLVFRAEITRVRKLSRLRIETELRRLHDSARSYRLLGAPAGASERSATPPPSHEQRLLRSGVDEIHQAVEFALDLLQRSLGLRTALLLGLDSSGETLSIQELASAEEGILPGPFSVKDGIFGACLAQNAQLSLSGPKAALHVPYYALPLPIGSVCATPLVDHGQARGLLVVDRESREPFTPREEEALRRAGHFILRAIENERVFIQLERAKVEQGKLYRAANALAAATTEAQVIEAGVNGAREFASFDFAVVTLFDKSSNEHEICAVSCEGGSDLVGQRFRHNTGLVSMVVANRHALPYRGDYDAQRQIVFSRRLAPPPMPSLLVLPLLVHEKVLGTLVLGSKRRSAFGDSVRPTLEVLASHVAVSLANARMLTRLEELATLDGLTNLLNKRALTEVANQKLRSAERFKKPLCVLICDIDHFKKVNDTYGHDIGDLVIKGFGDALRRIKRDTDSVGRFGGEEFVVVCEETDAQGGAQLAERIRTELEATTFHTDLGPLHVTCSIGVAPYPTAGRTWEALFKATDEALYASKRGGRNKVTVWNPRLEGCAA